MLEYPRPTLAKAVKGFIGLVNYYQSYQRHFKNLAAIARPSTALTALFATCASVQGQGHRERSPLKNIVVGGAFECMGMNFKEMDKSKLGNRYTLVLQDYLIK